MKNTIKDKIMCAESIVILSHINHDTDAIGSSFAMREVLRGMGKKAVCCLDEPLEKRMKFFGDDYILLNNAENKYDLAMVLDCGSIDRLGERLAVYESAKEKVSIDHHGTNTNFAPYNYVEADAAATGEILFYLFKEWGFELNDKAAMYLYSAIAGDSGCFKYSCASKRTMLAAAELMDYNFDHADVCLKLFDTLSEKVIRLHGHIMNSIRNYADGKISVVSTDEKLLEEYGVAEKDAGDIVSIPRSVEGTVIAVELKKRQGKIRVSLRSNCDTDVSVVAKELGGGGHTRAAGASVETNSIEEAEKRVVQLITEKCFDSLEK